MKLSSYWCARLFASLSLVCVVAFGYYAATQGLPALALLCLAGFAAGLGWLEQRRVRRSRVTHRELQRRVNGYTSTSVNVRRSHVG